MPASIKAALHPQCWPISPPSKYPSALPAGNASPKQAKAVARFVLGKCSAKNGCASVVNPASPTPISPRVKRREV